MANLDQGVPPEWPLVRSKRVFAYVKPASRDFDKVLAALRTIDASVVVHAPGVTPKAVQTHTAANIAFSADPVRMAHVRRDCHLAICHAGGTALGVGLVVDYEKPAHDYGRLLRRLLDEPSFTAVARAAADRHVGDDLAVRVARIVDRCEELMMRAALD